MRRALIIYAVFFALTLAIPALVCFSSGEKSNNSELVNIFSGSVSLIAYYH
ncbi:MAG: hypothetical protein NC397_01740 [Clostridium sp.]|nr:hypothetical protein [Clostridium sp.]